MTEKDVEIVDRVIDNEKDSLRQLSMKIWSNPELRNEEVYAHSVLTTALEEYGFTVQRHYLLPTAFRAEYSKGKGAVIAVLCEYDALPEIGHACGHNLISETGVAAGIAIKAVLDSDPSIVGKVVVLGCPAEEGGGGKILLIEKGAFKDIDAAIMAHPSRRNTANPQLICRASVKVTYKGREAHASAFPFEGLNALDAAVTAYVNIGLLRQQIKSDHRVHGIITEGGTACNVIPSRAKLEFFYRAPTAKELKVLRARVMACFESAALAAGCQVEYETEEWNTYLNIISNKVLLSLFKKHSNALGMHFVDDDPELLAAQPIGSGSSDVGNVSYVVPTIQPVFMTGPHTIHTREFCEQASTEKAHEGARTAAKALALTAIAMLRSPQLVLEAKEMFQQDIMKNQ